MITHLLKARLVTHLTEKLITDILPADPTQANVVKHGRYLSDPVQAEIVITAFGGDPDKPDVEDGMIAYSEIPKLGLRFPVGEVGGGRIWGRRGTIGLSMFFIVEAANEELASTYAYTVQGRVAHALDTCIVNDLEDEFGERAIGIMPYGATMFQSGGDNNFIFRGKVRWLAITERTSARF